MPTYTYRTEDGRTTERVFSMSSYPQAITLPDGTVASLIISQTAKMARNWAVKGLSSDLPDEGTPA